MMNDCYEQAAPTRALRGCALAVSFAMASACAPVELEWLTPEEMFDKALERHAQGEDVAVTAEPVPSGASAGKTIHVFTDAAWVDSYLGASSGNMEPLPIGTSIIRKIYGETNALEKMTVMVRADPVLYTELGGWVFGVFDPQGELLVAEDGPQMGELDACVGCHLGRASSQFLFGLPQR